jgi:hypothetical protein
MNDQDRPKVADEASEQVELNDLEARDDAQGGGVEPSPFRQTAGIVDIKKEHVYDNRDLADILA